MSSFRQLSAILFDYGNTLIEFSMAQIGIVDEALALWLERRFGPVDRTRLREIRDRDRRAPYGGDPPAYRENRLPEISRDLMLGLYEREPTPAEVDEIVTVRRQAFLDAVRAPDYLDDVLTRLGRRHRLGLVSNYPCGDTIRESLERLRLIRHFPTVVVSGDVGFVKPHAEPFRVALDRMGVKPEETIFVGDNWLADVQGAKRLGMAMVLTSQWGGSPEGFAPAPGDLEPDATIGHLTELETLLTEA